MKKILIIFFLTLICFSIKANDGIFFSSGGIFYPVIKNNISIEKEILTFTYLGDDKKDQFRWQVDVCFEFYNPGEEADFNLGFVFRLNPDENTNQSVNEIFKNFSIFINDQNYTGNLSAKYYSIKDNTSINKYLIQFKAHFLKGLNIVKHNYQDRGYIQMENTFYGQRGIRYVLTTGANWKGGVIKDLTLNISTKKDIFIHTASFPQLAEKDNNFNIAKCFFLKSSDTKTIRLANYIPLKEIDISAIIGSELLFSSDKSGFIHENRLINKYFPDADFPDEDFTLFYNAFYNEKLVNFNSKSISLLINAIYAYYGYDFTDKKIKSFFSNFYLYKPDKDFNFNYFPESVKKRINYLKKLK